LIIRIRNESQIQKNDIQDYFTQDVWKGFLHRFLEAIDEDATFDDDFESTWKHFMHECLNRMLTEIVSHKKLIEIKDLNSLTAIYDIYDISNTLHLNDQEFKNVVKKELEKMDKNPARDK
jgi:hypothetical protein